MAKQKRTGLPSRQEILDFIENSDTPAGKREIARAFGLSGHDKIALKQLLRDMGDEGLIDAGVVIGWINKPAATIARRRVGKGGLVVTTFRLTNDAPGTDPVAAALFDGLVTSTANLEVD